MAIRVVATVLVMLVAVHVGCSDDSSSDPGFTSAEEGEGNDGVTIGGPEGGTPEGGVPSLDAEGGSEDDGDTEPEIPDEILDNPPCETDEDCTTEVAPVCFVDAGVCVECNDAGDCEGNDICKDFSCESGVCDPGTTLCSGTDLLTCNADGLGYDTTSCAPGACIDGECAGCEPGTFDCQGATLVSCDQGTGTFVEVEDCGEPKLCSPDLGVCTECFPNEGACDGNDALQCAADGSGFVLKESCGAGESCFLGTCQSACDTDLKGNTNVGCDYWAVDLDNFFDPGDPVTAANAPFAVVVSNTTDSVATITITNGAGSVVATDTVAAKGLGIFELPSNNVDKTSIGPRAYRVQADQPIVAYQFNPLENVGVFSNDASVLLPSNAWGSEYLVMTWKQFTNGNSAPTLNGAVTVVAAFENTEVTVTPSAATRAGAGGIPALSAGEAWTTTLGPHDVLNIESFAENGDLTGTRVVSTQPVGVFGNHECAFTTDDNCCCDHLEEQMIPVSTWGKTYIANRSGVRYEEPDHWRILASKDGTLIQTNPSQGPTIQLDAGEWADIASKQAFQIDATHPILVGQFLASSFEIFGSCAEGCAAGTSCLLGSCEPSIGNLFCSGSDASSCLPGNACNGSSCEPIGDPAFILAPPVEQFLSEYIFLVPNNYIKDYLGVIAPTGAQIQLDSGTMINLTPLNPGAVWSSATIPIVDGTHSIRSLDNSTFGIVIHGFDDDVSYGYTGGLALEDLSE